MASIKRGVSFLFVSFIIFGIVLTRDVDGFAPKKEGRKAKASQGRNQAQSGVKKKAGRLQRGKFMTYQPAALLTVAAWREFRGRHGGRAKIDWSELSGTPHSIYEFTDDVCSRTGVRDPVLNARQFLMDLRGLYLFKADIVDLKLAHLVESIAKTQHVGFEQTYRGIPVHGAILKVHLDKQGRALMVNGEYYPNLGDVPTDPRVSEKEAVELAKKAVGVKVLLRNATTTKKIFKTANDFRLAWRVVIPAIEPYGTWEVFIDALSGATLQLFDMNQYVDGHGSVFNPNRIEQPNLQTVTLKDLDGSGYLRGNVVDVEDAQFQRAFQQTLNFNYPEAQPQFPEVCIYFYLANFEKSYGPLGWQGVGFTRKAFANVPDPQTGGPWNNAHYDPQIRGWRFGNGDGVRLANLDRDSDVAYHEFGHLVHDDLAHIQFQGQHTPTRAYGEAFGDTFACILNEDFNMGESTVPGQPYMRTMDNTKKFPDDEQHEEHGDGEIVTGAHHDIIRRMGWQPFGRLTLAAIPFTPSVNGTYPDFLRAYLQADQQINNGANRQLIIDSFAAHGITDGDGGEGDNIVRIDSGVPVQGTLDNGQFITYSIVAPQGSTQLEAVTTGAGDVDLFMAPSNNTQNPLKSQGPTSDETLVAYANTNPAISADTTWLIQVQGSADGSSYALTATVTAGGGGDQQGGELTSGVPVEGNVAAGQTIGYFIRLQQGTNTLVAETTGTGDADLYVAPQSNPNNGFSSEGQTSDEIITVDQNTNPPLSTDNVWLINVKGFTEASYTLKVTLSGGPTGGDVTPIVMGQTLNEDISVLGEQDFYSFQGQQGQVVNIAANRMSSTLDPTVYLLDSQRKILASDDDSGSSTPSGPGRNALIGNFPLPYSGQYFIVVASYVDDVNGPTTIGPYSISLTESAGGGNNELSDGQPVNGTASTGEMKQFYIRVPQESTTLKITTTGSGDIDLYAGPSNGGEYFELSSRGYDSNEQIFIDNTTTPPLSKDTVWLIGVYGYQSGEYTLTASINAQPDEQLVYYEILLGQTFLGALGDPGEVDFIGFEALGGTKVALTMSAPKGSAVAPALALFDFDGNRLPSIDKFNTKKYKLTATLPPETGIYFAAVSSGLGAGNYIVKTKGKVPKTGGKAEGFLTLTEPVLWYRFNAAAGSSVKIKVNGVGNKLVRLVPYVEVYNPLNERIGFADGAPKGKVNLRGGPTSFTMTGEYLVGVSYSAFSPVTVGGFKINVKVKARKAKGTLFE